MQIAIDGPAGAGKSTVARAVADKLGFLYLDTGAMYRGIGVAAAERGVNTKDAQAVRDLLAQTQLEVRFEGKTQHILVNGEDVTDRIREEEIGLAASDVATVSEVREYLVNLQREIAAAHDVIMDGRDIGSWVLPNAEFKFFITASPRTRAERRCSDLRRAGLEGPDCDVDLVEKEILARDRQDATRSVAPLRHTPGEILLDTSAMTLNEVVKKVLETVGKDA